MAREADPKRRRPRKNKKNKKNSMRKKDRKTRKNKKVTKKGKNKGMKTRENKKGMKWSRKLRKGDINEKSRQITRTLSSCIIKLNEYGLLVKRKATTLTRQVSWCSDD